VKLEAEPLLKPDPALAGTLSVAPGWRVALPLLIATVIAIVGIYWRTAESIVAIWWRSETFAHGFLIVPISLALVWMRRREVARLVPSGDYLIAAAGWRRLAWLVANAGRCRPSSSLRWRP
jgi:hypothetical protein